MNKTLLILSTYFVNEGIISEYKKMRNTKNVDVILAINNHNYNYDFKNRIENIVFYGVSVRCFFFDSKLHDELELTYFVFTGSKDFAGVMWNNGDYRFYYVRKFFPDYNYYWQFDNDVFCNAPTYDGFLSKFSDDNSDLAVQSFREETKNGNWIWSHGTEWIYNDKKIYGSFFPAVRLSARAIDFLYKKRLEHKKIFQDDGKNKWLGCELFVPTELMNGGFSCSKIVEPKVTFNHFYYLNDDRFFLTPDNLLYHPVKPIRGQISKLQKQNDDLNLSLRKLFLNTVVNILRGITAAAGNFSVQFEKDFRFAILVPAKGGGGADYYVLQINGDNIYIALHCENNLADIDVSEFGNLNKLQGFGVNKTKERFAILTFIPTDFQNTFHVANVMKNLIETTYPVIEKKLSQ